MKVLLIGAGAIGGTVAVLLKNAGYDVRLMCHRSSVAELIGAEGFFLHGAKGEYRADFTCYSDYAETGEEKFDLVIIATKYASMKECAASALPLVADGGLVVGMQNGILTEELAEVVGRDKAVGCMIGFGATKNSANDVTMTSKGEFYVGMLDGRRPKLLDEFADMLKNVLPTEVTMDIKGRQYSKLIINSCINAVAGITGKTLGEILRDVRARDLFLSIAREGMAVAEAMGVRVPKYGLLLEYRLLSLSDGRLYNSLCKLVVRAVGLLYSDVRPSTLQSLEKGERTEIDILNGYFVKMGAEHSVPTPVNSRLVAMIHEIEEGKRKSVSDNLDEFC